MASTLTKGQRVKFKAYAVENPEPVFEPGDLMVIDQIEDNGNIAAYAINSAGQLLSDAGDVVDHVDNAKGDTLWDNEIDPATATPDAVKTVEAFDPTTATGPALLIELNGLDIEKPAGWGKMKVDAKRAAFIEATKPVEAFDVDKASGPEIATELERLGVEKPAGWGKLKVSVKRGLFVQLTAETPDEVKADQAPAEVAEEVQETKSNLPVAAETVETPDIVDTPTVAELLATTDAIEAARELASREHKTAFTLGGVLSFIHRTGAHKKLGYEGKRGFANFCEEELDTDYRKAMYLIQIYEAFAAMGVDEGVIEQVGWSKAAQLARIPRAALQANWTALIAVAKSKTRKELIVHIEENYEVTTRGDRVKRVSFSFAVVEGDAETVRRALDQAMQTTGAENEVDAFTYICGDYLNEAPGSDLDIDSFMELALAKFGADAIATKLDEHLSTPAVETAETADTTE